MNTDSGQRRDQLVNNLRSFFTLSVFAFYTVLLWSCRYAAATESESLNEIRRGPDATDRRILAGALDAATVASLNGAKSAALRTLNLIYQRYEFSTPRIQFLLVAANMPNSAWNIMKYKTALKFVSQKSTFKFIFGGSSVTAGHDNFFNESYPSIFESRVSDVFKSLEINLEVHNIAHGTNKCRPSDLCYEAMGGDNADWIGWEQSFDCGRDKGVFELMARTAFWNRAVVFFSASGGVVPAQCPPSNDTVPWISEEWSPDLEPSLKGHEYAPDAAALLAFKERTNSFFLDGNSVQRFTESFGDNYPGVAAHGFSVWGASKTLCENDITGKRGCGALEVMGDCQGNRGGNHWMTREASIYAAGRGAPHHPPRGMHMQRGEFIAFNYLHIFLDAINMLEEDLRTITRGGLAAVYQAELDRLQPQTLPPARHCAHECNTPAVCYTDYEPNYNPSHLLSNIIVGPGNTTNSLNTDWIRVSRGSRDVRLNYKDIKIVYETTGSNNTMYVKLDVSNTDYFRVCGSNVKESMERVHFFFDFNVTTRDRNYVPSKNLVHWKKRKYVQDECTLVSGVPPGHHVLALVCAGGGCAFTHLVSFV